MLAGTIGCPPTAVSLLPFFPIGRISVLFVSSESCAQRGQRTIADQAVDLVCYNLVEEISISGGFRQRRGGVRQSQIQVPALPDKLCDFWSSYINSLSVRELIPMIG